MGIVASKTAIPIFSRRDVVLMANESNNLIKGNPLLSNEIISRYDIRKTKDAIIKTMNQLEEWKYAFLNLIPPKITQNYEVRYEMPDFNNKVDKVGDFIEKKSDLELEIISMHFNLNKILSNFNNLEVMYYDMYYVKKISEANIEEELDVGHTLGRHIKNSLTVKLALGLGIAVKK